MLVSVDLETHLIKPGCLAPRMVCLSEAQGTQTGLYLREEGLEVFRKHLKNKDFLIGHNAPYDLGVICAEDPSFLPLIFDALDEDRIACTMTRQKLLDVALGMRKFRRINRETVPSKYGLADLVQLYFKEHLEKENTWRLKYALLDGVPLEEWPVEAREYAIGDAVQALRVYEAQSEVMREEFGDLLPNEPEQQRTAWALHLMSMWGVRADAANVEKFITHCEEQIAKMHKELDGSGIFKADGSRTMAEIRRRVVESLTRLSVQVPMTEPSSRFPDGQVQTDKETLDLTDDPHLHILAESMSFQKHLDQWGPVCRAAVQRPVCSRYNVLVDTGRTSCNGGEGQEGSNMQNPPRKGDVRSCFIPRSGFVFCSTDADTIELRAHAQNCYEMLGWSRMREVLIKQHAEGGPDLHLTLGAAILEIDPFEALTRYNEGDKEVEDARQFAKIPNFGFPGGLGPNTFVSYAAAQGQKLGATEKEAFKRACYLRKVWFETWPENKEYFDIVNELVESGNGRIEQRISKRIRGGATFTSTANGLFQGRVADAMKEILWRLAYECYTGRMTNGKGRSVLYGSRPVMFLHDEPILEHPEETAHERAERQQQIMVEGLNKWMPDVPCTSSAVLFKHWYKGAKPLKVDGRLVPVRPEKVDQNILWVAA